MKKNIYSFITAIVCSGGLYAASHSPTKELFVEMPHCCVMVRFEDAMPIYEFKAQALNTIMFRAVYSCRLFKPLRPGYVAGTILCKGSGPEYVALEDHKTCADCQLRDKDVVCLVPIHRETP